MKKSKGEQKALEKRLDKGEASSIALALEIDNPILIIDEIKGRKIAQSFKIDIIGTIGIILLAEKKGYLTDVLSTILRLVNKGFRLSDKLINKIIEKYSRNNCQPVIQICHTMQSCSSKERIICREHCS